MSGASSGRGEGWKIKDALLARETVEQVDDFAGRVKAKRVEFAPRTTLSSLAERLNDGRLPDGEVVANLESEIRRLYEVGGRRFRVALLPTEIPASREPGLRLNPQLRRIPAEMRADLTSAEIAMSGSYFDDVLRDPRRYGIENSTDKVRRPGAVRRRRDAVCTERIVASLHRKRLGARKLGRRRELRAEAFSIRRLEGSRWRLRRTLAMGIECRFGTGKPDGCLPSSSGNPWRVF
jgi:hypothetical protein